MEIKVIEREREREEGREAVNQLSFSKPYRVILPLKCNVTYIHKSRSFLNEGTNLTSFESASKRATSICPM